MTNPIVHSFFVGRALAETLYERAEASLTNALSDLGKLDAELREELRQFTEQVMARAEAEAQAASQNRPTTAPFATDGVGETDDLQTVIDELRAEIARLRSELKEYRSRTN